MRKRNLKRWRRRIVWIIGGSFVALNGVACMQAHAMTHFVAAGIQSLPPEQLGWRDKAKILVSGVSVPRPVNSITPTDVGLSYKTQRIEIDADTVLEAWFVTHAASCATVLLFPPYAASKAALLEPARIFHDLGYTVLLVDPQGVGGSSGDTTTLGVRESADVARAVDYAHAHWPDQPIVLYGVSMGAVAVLRAVAVDGVQPAALIIESPFDSLLNAVRVRFRTMGLPAFPGAELVVLWGSVQQHMNGFVHRPAEYARAVGCPTLLLYGDHDPRVPTTQIENVFTNLIGSKTRVAFATTNHELLIDADGLLWQQQIAQFLAMFP